MRLVLIALSMMIPAAAWAQARSPQVKRTNPPELSTPTGYTHVVEVTGPSKTLYIAGQIAFDKDGKLVGDGDMKAQAEQVRSVAVRRVGRRIGVVPAALMVRVDDALRLHLAL